MVAHIVSAARTPWALRHSVLASVRPEVLLQAAMAAAVERAGLHPKQIDRALVACDTSVGAQDLNIARRSVISLGWQSMPALTIDGQGVGGLALVDLAASLPGRTIVAGVDASSLVPPGAGQVRDYGRPSSAAPEIEWLEELASHLDFSKERLDTTVLSVQRRPLTNASIVAIGPGSSEITTDPKGRKSQLEGLSPLLGPDGIQTAAHLAEYADGAAAIVVDSRTGQGRSIDGTGFRAGAQESTIERMVELTAALDPMVISLLADPSAVVLTALLDTTMSPTIGVVASTLSLGSTPSIDGLRVLVDAFHNVDGPAQILCRGSAGQVASVSMASQTSLDRAVV